MNSFGLTKGDTYQSKREFNRVKGAAFEKAFVNTMITLNKVGVGTASLNFLMQQTKVTLTGEIVRLDGVGRMEDRATRNPYKPYDYIFVESPYFEAKSASSTIYCTKQITNEIIAASEEPVKWSTNPRYPTGVLASSIGASSIVIIHWSDVSISETVKKFARTMGVNVFEVLVDLDKNTNDLIFNPIKDFYTTSKVQRPKNKFFNGGHRYPATVAIGFAMSTGGKFLTNESGDDD